jgi:hypothetical protein
LAQPSGGAVSQAVDSEASSDESEGDSESQCSESQCSASVCCALRSAELDAREALVDAMLVQVTEFLCKMDVLQEKLDALRKTTL